MFTALEIKILGGLALVIALAMGIWAYDKHQQTLGAAQFKAEAAEQALAATQENLRESNRRTAAVNQKAADADQSASAARADADAAHSAGDRLLQRISALRRGGAGHPQPAIAGASAPGAADLYAAVLARTVQAARLIGDFADRSRIAGQACEQSYLSLKP